MTIDRMLRRGVFPILSQRPLDESDSPSVASAKVYVIEVGAYSNRYIDAIFTTRELAEAFVADRQRRAFEREGIKAHRVVEGWTYPKLPSVPGRVVKGKATYRSVPAETFEEFVKRHDWNEFGDVEEYDLWDMIPVVPESSA